MTRTMHRPVARLAAVTVVAAVAVAACGGGGSEEASTVAAVDPDRDRQIAERAAFRDFDFPAGWQSVDVGAPGSPVTLDALGECLALGDRVSADLRRGYRYGEGVNTFASIRVVVLRGAGDVTTAVAPIGGAEQFDACVSQRVTQLLAGAIQGSLDRLESKRTALTTTLASGVAFDMTGYTTTPTGSSVLYPGVAYLHRGRTIAILTVLSNHDLVEGLVGALATKVAERMSDA